MRKVSAAFTLLELLAVISIVALLAAMLFPVFATARAKSRQVVCLSNLRQLGVGVALYAQDYDQYYPFGADPSDKYGDIWEGDAAFLATVKAMPLLPEILEPYVRNREIWRCPEDTGFDASDMQTDKNGQPVRLPARPTCYEKYGMSYFYRTSLAFGGKLYGSLTAYEQFPPHREHSAAEIIILMDASATWHRGNVNTLMGDGHAVQRSAEQSRENFTYGRAAGN